MARSTQDAASARFSSRRPVHLVRGEYRHLRQCLGLSRPAARLAYGEPRQARLLVSADDHFLRAHLPDPRYPPPRSDEVADLIQTPAPRSEEHTSELQSLMRISYAVFCL